ncbi:MAG: hypothetical protein Q7V57_09350 [Actinomycetota bacterium]|nr:hypothetical protein [Actinomycetota bacterium]
MALKNKLPERMFTALLPVGEQYLIGLRALSVGGVHALAWGTGGAGQVALLATNRQLVMCGLDKLGRPNEVLATLPYTDIVAMNTSRTKVAFTSIGVVEIVFPDGSNFQFECTAGTVDEFVELVRPCLSTR